MSLYLQEDTRPSDPAPEWRRAVRMALAWFAPFGVPAGWSLREWRVECEHEAWLAVLRSASQYRCPDPPPTDPESHYVLWLAGRALKHLRAYRAKERAYYSRVMPMVVPDEEGEEVEREFVDVRATEAMEAVLERLAWEQVLARLGQRLDTVDWAIVEGLMGGKTQREVALMLGVSQSAVSQRWVRICALVRQVAGDWG